MNQWLPLDYREFHLVPRTFLVRYQEQLFLFHSVRRPTTDDYTDRYQVYLMPEFTPESLRGSWAEFPMHAIALMGEVPVADVIFANGRVDAAVFDRFYVKR